MRIYVLILWCFATVLGGGVQAATNGVPAAGASNILSAASRVSDSTYLLDDKHTLSPGDHISFRVLEDRDPAVSLTVADSRELEVPYVGRVSVEGKTCKKLAAELKVRLEKDYYVRATVILGVDMVNKVRGKVYILGPVRTQGAIELLFDEPLTAGKAILKAGGFGDFASKTKVKVVRDSKGAGKEKKTFEVNMVDVLEKGKVEQDIVLEPDDLIVVPEKGVIY